LISLNPVPNSPLTVIGSISVAIRSQREKRVLDLIYLSGGVVVLLLFAGYAALLRRT
jgi:hypothetical protein